MTAQYAFLHVPKTAGTSVLRVLEHLVGKTNISPAVGAHFDAVDIDRLRAYPLVVGHFNWTQLAVLGPRRILTFLREPIDQLLSQYFFYRGMPESLTEPVVRYCKQATLEEAVSDDSLEASLFFNGCTRQFAPAGPDIDTPGIREVALAQEHLAACEFVGLYEELPDSLEVMSFTFGWPAAPDLPRENVTIGRRSVRELDPSLVARLRERNRADVELYEHAVALFQARKRGILRHAVLMRIGNTQADALPPPLPLPLPPKVDHRKFPQTSEGRANEDVRVRIVQVAVYGTRSGGAMIASAEETRITVSVIAHTDVDDMNVGIQIRNPFDQLLFGTNTVRRAYKVSMAAGSMREIVFAMSMRLAPGTYTVSATVGIRDGSQQRLLHRLESGATFEVVGFARASFSGICDLAPKLSSGTAGDLGGLYRMGTPIDFAGVAQSYALTGFGRPEDWGIWTVGAEAQMYVRLTEACSEPLTVVAHVMPFCPAGTAPLTVHCVANGHRVGEWLFDAGAAPQQRQLVIPNDVHRGGPLHLLWRMRDPRSPAALGLGTDDRLLGLGFIRLLLCPQTSRDAGGRCR